MVLEIRRGGYIIQFQKEFVAQCILKAIESKFIILVLYVDDILLACSDIDCFMI